MNNRKKQKTRAIVRRLGELFSIIAVCGIFAVVAREIYVSRHTSPERPRCEMGEIDLSSWDFTQGAIKLDGQWDFRWGKLLDPRSPEWGSSGSSAARGFYSVPQFWTKYAHRFPAKGCASYRLVVHVSGAPREYGLWLPEIFTEYSLWVNGRIVAENGIVAGMRARYLNPGIVTFMSEKSDIEIVLQIKNVLHKNAGIGQSFRIGEAKRISREYLASISMEIILIAICLFSGLYHLVVFFFRKGDWELLHFGLFCIIIAVRTFTIGNTLVSVVFPAIPFAIGFRLALFIIPLAVLSFHNFAWALLGRPGGKELLVPYTAFHLIVSALSLFLPTYVFSIAYSWFLLSIFATIIWIFVFTVRGVIRKMPYSGQFLVCYLLLVIGATNDILHYMQVVNTGYFLALYFSAFIFSQSLLIAVKFSVEHQTVLRLSDQLKSIDHLKDEFLANTSHELRTPLNGIIGIAESLAAGATGALSEETVKNVNMIVSSGKRLSSLVNDILDYSKLKNHDISIRKQPVDMRQIVSIVLTVTETTSPNPSVRLINDISEEMPLVEGDENRLQQILYNLVGNSVKFTRHGHVRVSCSVRGEMLEVHVEDTGIGIEAERMDRIFRSFEQADGSISREYGGTGLGLSITSELVALHGGAIRVESVPGKGSVFSFTVPIVRQHADGPVATAFDPAMSAAPARADVASREKPDLAGKKRILIVDDELINIQVLLNFLSLHGYSADYAPDGEKALDLVMDGGYDLVLLDVMMPRVSGYEVCKRIRERFSAHELPVIFLTAKNQSAEIVTAFEVGGNDYLVKPLNQAELFARIDMHITMTQAVRDAIENARLASTDALTELHNRRSFMETGAREFIVSKRLNHGLSVVMLDIDNFKTINDTFGHDIGDTVLRKIAAIISESVRNIDLPSRFGGDEFLILLPGTTKASAKTIAERIRLRTEKASFLGKDMPCTVSVGVADIGGDTPTFEELLRKADKMLYESKRRGRNFVSASD